MSEDQTTLENENSVDQADGNDVDWQKRYTDTQAEYTRQQQTLKDEQKVWEDEPTFLARVQEKYPHLIADADTADDDDEQDEDLIDDEPQFARLSPEDAKRLQAHDEWIAEQAQKEATKTFNEHLVEEAGDRKLGKPAKDWIFNETVRLGDGRENLKKALAAWIEFQEADRAEYLADLKKSKRAPHVPANGKAATGTKPLEDMTREEHTAWMVEQALARDSQ